MTEVNLSIWILSVVEPSDLPPAIADEAKLERVVTEWLHNACKYTPEGERIAISAVTAGNRMRLLVTKSGVEIPLGERERIFDKFYRIPNKDP